MGFGVWILGFGIMEFWISDFCGFGFEILRFGQKISSFGFRVCGFVFGLRSVEYGV